LMHEYHILENKINNVKANNFEITPQDEIELKKLKFEQGKIMQQVERLMML
jgi:hypothetical protein